MTDFTMDQLNTRHGPEDFYNAQDLNRIEAATKYLADLLVEYGYHISIIPRQEVPAAAHPVYAFDEATGEMTSQIIGQVEIPAHAEWIQYDIPTSAECDRILDNIRLLQSTYMSLPSTPPLPDTMNDLGWQEANDIEQVLADMYVVLTRIAAAWFYSDEIYSGEV